MERLNKLFSPIQIGTMALKNRIVMPAMCTFYGTPEGFVTDRTVEYHRARARGGVGLNIVEHTAVAPDGIYAPQMLCIYDDRYISWFERLARAVHEEGGKVAIQLNHVGRQGSSAYTGMQLVAPSPIPCPVRKEVPHGLTVEEIPSYMQAYADGAARSKEAGADAIEIHGAHGYLICEFLSPFSNRREDEYGGDRERRCRFAAEILKAVRARVGPDFPVLLRISANEYVEGGLDLEESKGIIQVLLKEGVDAIHVSVCTAKTAAYASACYYLEEGSLVPYAAGIKSVVDVPVIAVGRIKDPRMAEQILREGKTDLVAMGRALIADPEMPDKAARGAFDEIIPCISCNLGCLDRRRSPMRYTHCVTNPRAGREREFDLKPASIPKKVLVVGGGPAGLQAAAAAAQRGHKVILCEQTDRLGGTFLLAAIPPEKKELSQFTDYLVGQVKKQKVEIRLNREVTPDTVAETKPDAVILATGASYRIPEIKGVDRIPLVHATEVLSGEVKVGDRVLMMGGGSVGVETADFLAQQGKKVTIVEQLPQVAEDMVVHVWFFLEKRLVDAGVEMMTSSTVRKVDEDGVLVEQNREMKKLENIDTIVVAFGTKPGEALAEKLRSGHCPVYLIGDALKPAMALEAVYEGYKVAMEI